MAHDCVASFQLGLLYRQGLMAHDSVASFQLGLLYRQGLRALGSAYFVIWNRLYRLSVCSCVETADSIRRWPVMNSYFESCSPLSPANCIIAKSPPPPENYCLDLKSFYSTKCFLSRLECAKLVRGWGFYEKYTHTVTVQGSVDSARFVMGVNPSLVPLNPLGLH